VRDLCNKQRQNYIQYILLFFLCRQPHEVERQTLFGSEVTRKKIKQLEVEGTRAPVPYMVGDVNACVFCTPIHKSVRMRCS